VIEALEKGRIGPRGHGYLVFGPDPREVVARCTACQSLGGRSAFRLPPLPGPLC
jgi:hypothetical protein